jgi:hypothetical protein
LNNHLRAVQFNATARPLFSISVFPEAKEVCHALHDQTQKEILSPAGR